MFVSPSSWKNFWVGRSAIYFFGYIFYVSFCDILTFLGPIQSWILCESDKHVFFNKFWMINSSKIYAGYADNHNFLISGPIFKI